jgi:predicted RNA-binding protein with PIN domain
MHYYIDGYNMLFRLMYARPDDLQMRREKIIQELNKKVALIKIDVSIVFDATFQEGDRSRSHFQSLEILFTAQGETADEFILDELKNSRHPQQEIIVTSDKKLAWHARHSLAQTKSVESFYAWLNAAYKNKLNQKSVTLTPAKPVAPLILPPTPSSEIANCSSYYEHIFEARFQENIQKEESHKKKSAKPPARRPKKIKPPEIQAPSEMERWLKAFENRWDQFNA